MPFLTSKGQFHSENPCVMPEEETVERAREDEREGLSPSTQAGEFVREEMDHIREGKHGARSPQQAIAIGLSKARRAGVKLPPPKRGKTRTKHQAKRDLAKGRRGGRKKPSRTRSRATRGGVETRGPFRCVPQSALQTRAFSSATTVHAVAFRCCKEGRSHEKTPAIEPARKNVNHRSPRRLNTTANKATVLRSRFHPEHAL